jgi:hypothetical protein
MKELSFIFITQYKGKHIVYNNQPEPNTAPKTAHSAYKNCVPNSTQNRHQNSNQNSHIQLTANSFLEMQTIEKLENVA